MEKRMKWLRKKLARQIGKGGKVIVIGWIGRNHSQLTKFLSERDLVKFIAGWDIKKGNLDKNSFVLSTRFRRHILPGAGDSNGSQWPILNIGQIKSLLEPIAARLIADQKARKEEERMEKNTTKPASAGTAPEAGSGVEPARELTDEERRANFVREFTETCGCGPDGALSKYKATTLVRKHFGPKARPSQFPDLLTGVVSKGDTKVGRYRPSETLLELATQPDQEPADPLERARWLIAREPKIRERLADLKREIEKLEGQLKKIELAKNLLGQLEKL